MGTLKTGRLDLNDERVVKSCNEALGQIASRESSYYALRFKPQYYFETQGAEPPRSGGWYVILEAATPIYVGRADDLNGRLNSNHGSTDNFAKKERTSDAERNFVKKFDELGHFKRLRVYVFPQDEFFQSIGVDPSEVTNTDKENIEKLLNIRRGFITFRE
jgi:hypothetical protein